MLLRLISEAQRIQSKLQDLHCIQLGVYTFQSPALRTERSKELQRDIGESLEQIREL